MKKGILMISSTSIKGGGPEHMFKLGENIAKEYRVFFAIPYSKEYLNLLSKKNHIAISERKISIFDIFKLIKFIRKNSIEIIHAHGKGAGLLGRILNLFVRRSLIYSFHGIHIMFYSKFIKKIYLIYENIFGRIDSMKIFVSNSENEYAKKNNLIINKDKFSIINNAVSNMKIINSNLDQEALNKSINIRNDSLNIISVCRLVKQKNIYELIEIAKLLPQYNFIILGNGPLFIEVSQFIKKKKIRNIYMPGQTNNVFKYLYASQIYLSTSFYEGLSISILEAMSVGLPIVASKVVGNVDAIQHLKSGFLYELGDVSLAADYILEILKNEELFLKISKSSQLRQRKLFSYDYMVAKYLKIYKNF